MPKDMEVMGGNTWSRPGSTGTRNESRRDSLTCTNCKIMTGHPARRDRRFRPQSFGDRSRLLQRLFRRPPGWHHFDLRYLRAPSCCWAAKAMADANLWKTEPRLEGCGPRIARSARGGLTVTFLTGVRLDSWVEQ